MTEKRKKKRQRTRTGGPKARTNPERAGTNPEGAGRETTPAEEPQPMPMPLPQLYRIAKSMDQLTEVKDIAETMGLTMEQAHRACAWVVQVLQQDDRCSTAALSIIMKVAGEMGPQETTDWNAVAETLLEEDLGFIQEKVAGLGEHQRLTLELQEMREKRRRVTKEIFNPELSDGDEPGSPDDYINPYQWPGRGSTLIKELLRQTRETGDETSEEEAEDAAYKYRVVMKILRVKTKRIVFDTNQYIAFLDPERQPEDPEVFAGMEWPFNDTIYIEFSDPLEGNNNVWHGVMVPAGEEPRSMALMTTGDEELTCLTSKIHLDGRDIVQEEENTRGTVIDNSVRQMVAYMTARNIELVDEPLTRQARRKLERKKQVNPWRMITVAGGVRRNVRASAAPPGIRHSLRYDVMGHLRFGRHRLKDGSYRHTREWVKPHQRGLANANYIPKIRRFLKQKEEET